MNRLKIPCWCLVDKSANVPTQVGGGHCIFLSRKEAEAANFLRGNNYAIEEAVAVVDNVEAFNVPAAMVGCQPRGFI